MLALFLIAICVVFRLVPHPPNFAPVGGAAIFAGRKLSTKMALATTLVAMVASDWMLSRFHGYRIFTMVTPFVYAAFAMQVLLGKSLRKVSGGSAIAAFTGAFLFYGVSNFGVWMQGVLYPKTWEGLVACYIAALPFFKYTMIGNLFWVFMFCAGDALMKSPVRRLREKISYSI